MNILLFSFVFLILTLPTTENAMDENAMEAISKKYAVYYEVPSEISLDESDDNEQSIEWRTLSQEFNNSEQSVEWETLNQESSDGIHAINNHFHFFTLLPNELIIDMLLDLTLKDFFSLLKTDRLRYTLCSEKLIQRFLLEERYTKNLPKHISTHSNIFPIEGQTAILNLSMLLMIAAKAGYTDDFRVLFNRPSYLTTKAGYTDDFHILFNRPPFLTNMSSEEATALLTTAVESEQIGIIKQLIIIKQKITAEKLEEIINLSENKKIKKLLKKKKNSKMYSLIKTILYPSH